MQTLKRLFTLITRLSLCAFMLVSFYRFIDQAPLLAYWWVTFAGVAVGVSGVTLCNLFGILLTTIKQLWRKDG